MLNTSLQQPNVKDKTTLERFISMNRGINNGGRTARPAAHETLRQHPQRAVQDPRGRRERPHAHLLQPRPRGLAPQARRPREDLEETLVHPDGQLPVLL
ncbi:hypothetical protein CRUP_005592 [Coryphaenoides rupestris]|nr:hypothetical protein CRUP_005592 [Coryphaenoides rupestris]